MKNIIILGAGRQGLAAGTFLKKKHIAVTFTDINDNSINMAHDMGFITMKRNLSSVSNIVKVISGFDIAICALPAKLGRTAHLAAIEAKTDMVDVSYSEEDPLELDEKAKEANITIIPDAGAAPGISSLISGYIYFQMDTINSIKINVGGLPEKYIEPMGYAITWSPNDLIDEYIRPARIKINNEIIAVDALSEIDAFSFKEYDKLESFYSDGLRTLLLTLKKAENLIEKTVRYFGHGKQMKFLRDMGYFDDSYEDVYPRKTTVRLFSKIKTDLKDIVIMRVEGNGIINNNEKKITFDLFDKGQTEFSAMERCTGFSLGAFTLLLIEDLVKDKGVIPPELLAQDTSIFKKIIELLIEENIEIKEY